MSSGEVLALAAIANWGATRMGGTVFVVIDRGGRTIEAGVASPDPCDNGAAVCVATRGSLLRCVSPLITGRGRGKGTSPGAASAAPAKALTAANDTMSRKVVTSTDLLLTQRPCCRR
jgi:hypothetical protein